MNLFEDMRVFVVVVEAGGFSAAAQRLNIAKSVVSRRMSALERHLECRLFNRTTRRLSLTETGLDYFERTQRILRDLAEAEEATRSLQNELRGRLRAAEEEMAAKDEFDEVIVNDDLGRAVEDILKCLRAPVERTP